MTPPKPEPVETAEHIVQMLAGEDLELTGFSVRQRDAMTKRIVARDAALVADAEARGARRALDDLEDLFLLHHRTYTTNSSIAKALKETRAKYARSTRKAATMAGEDGVCPNCWRVAYDAETRPVDFCVEVSGYWPKSFDGDSCAERTIANLRTQLKAAEAALAEMGRRAVSAEHAAEWHKARAGNAGLHRAWVPCAERMPGNSRLVFAQTDEGHVYLMAWVWDKRWEGGDFGQHERVVAWHELPAPYEAEVNHADD